MLRLLLLALLLTLLSPHSRAAMEELIPSEKETRKKIDELIKSCSDGGRKVTLGVLQEAMSLSISYGAVMYNQGDRDGCFKFYAKTAQSLCAAFPEQKPATEMARRALTDLKVALERVRRSGDTDRNAWSMRYVFDKAQLAVALHVEHLQGLVGIAEGCFKRAQFEESEDALAAAVAMLEELEGQSRENIPIGCRYARLAIGHTYFAQKKYKEAATAIDDALKHLPEWPGLTLDLRSLHRDPAEYEDLMADLQSVAKKEPENAALQFLLGYECYYTGRKAMAKEHFEAVRKLDAAHSGANLLLKKIETPAPTTPIGPNRDPAR
jgi:tetratricopeptide (TPR) repeat protein